MLVGTLEIRSDGGSDVGTWSIGRYNQTTCRHWSTNSTHITITLNYH